MKYNKSIFKSLEGNDATTQTFCIPRDEANEQMANITKDLTSHRIVAGSLPSSYDDYNTFDLYAKPRYARVEFFNGTVIEDWVIAGQNVPQSNKIAIYTLKSSRLEESGAMNCKPNFIYIQKKLMCLPLHYSSVSIGTEDKGANYNQEETRNVSNCPKTFCTFTTCLTLLLLLIVTLAILCFLAFLYCGGDSFLVGERSNGRNAWKNKANLNIYN